MAKMALELLYIYMYESDRGKILSNSKIHVLAAS